VSKSGQKTTTDDKHICRKDAEDCADAPKRIRSHPAHSIEHRKYRTIRKAAAMLLYNGESLGKCRTSRRTGIFSRATDDCKGTSCCFQVEKLSFNASSINGVLQGRGRFTNLGRLCSSLLPRVIFYFFLKRRKRDFVTPKFFFSPLPSFLDKCLSIALTPIRTDRDSVPVRLTERDSVTVR
jgi:hypothetical protein